MELAFRTHLDSTRWAFTLHFETQSFFAHAAGGSPRLGIQAFFRRSHNDRSSSPTLFPVLIDLHGALTRQNGLGDTGMPLLPVKEWPVYLLPTYGETLVNLAFEVSRGYLQMLEEQRAQNPNQGVVLTLNLWGIAAMVRPSTEEPTPFQARTQPGDTIRFERFETDPNSYQTIRFERSTWIDRILPGLGYQQSMLIEIPLVKTPALPEPYQRAVAVLEQAHQAFNHEDYRSAIKYGREVLEYLGNLSSDGSKQLSKFCKEYLEPLAGETKSSAVDTSLASIRKITNASSHATSFHADRATAAYVIETLALNLRYIATLLSS